MKYLVDSREMQKYDANTISHFKVPGLLLMERAAIAFVEELHRQNVDLTEVLIVCGSGNNGGDGLAIARLLFLEGHAVTVVYAGNKEHCSESNRVQQDILNAYGISIYMDIPEKINPTLVIDAIFGVGLSRDVTGEYADMVKKHFMKLVKPTDHKFAALHGAVWSGGSFVYVPKGVSVEIPLQSYFRLNAPGAGQFEHTLIIVDEGADLHFIEGCSAPKYNVANLHAGCVELFVGKNARLRYSTIENWSKNMYNLNTKRALVEEGGTIEWVSGSFGSHVSYLYPMSILKGRDSKMEFTGITFAGKGQNLDTGAKVVHIGENTSSYINTKSISKDGGISTFRSSVVVNKGAESAKSAVSCQSLMLDSESRSDTIPAMDIRTKNANVGHEAQIGSISDEAVFYLMSRGMSEEDARACIVSGFADNVSKELPLEYALEMNNLIRLEMKGSIG